jgi:sec-independent protein translocase protein TatC
MLGFVVAFPYVFYEIWRFVKPGLHKNEKNATRGVVFVCSLLFISGVLFGYYVISPFAISFLSNYTVGELTVNAPTLSSYVGYMIMFTLPAGLIFELPIVVYFLAKMGIMGPKTMKMYRKHALVGILVLAAMITPPDVITQFLIAIPLYTLWEISIIIAKRVYKEV